VPVHHGEFRTIGGYDAPRFDVRRFLALVREGRQLVEQQRAALIHCNSAAPTQWMLPVARRLRLPLLVQLHAPYLRRDRFTLGLTQASLVVGVSSAVLRGLLDDGMPDQRTRVVHLGQDLGRLRTGGATGLRAELGIPADAIVVVSVGSLIRRKGFDILLRATSRLAPAPDVRVLIVGAGPERTNLEALAAELSITEAVRFLGERDDVGAILRDTADILVSAARSEAFGLTLVEAGGCGLPVIAPAVDGIPEVVVDGETGLLIAPEDEAELARAIARLARDPELRERLGAAGRTRVETHFSIARYVDEIQQAYDELLTRPREKYGWLGEWSRPWAYVKWLASVGLGRVFGGKDD